MGSEACRILLLPRGVAGKHALLVQVDPENMAKHEIAPLLEIQLELIVPDIVWIPELGSGGAPGVRDMFSKWFKSFLEIATLIKRLDTGEGQLLHAVPTCLHPEADLASSFYAVQSDVM